MQSFLERRNGAMDTSEPGVRHIQELIRNRTPVAIQVLDSEREFEGVIRWQDSAFLALAQAEDRPLTLINREAATVIRALV